MIINSITQELNFIFLWISNDLLKLAQVHFFLFWDGWDVKVDVLTTNTRILLIILRAFMLQIIFEMLLIFILQKRLRHWRLEFKYDIE